jgi:hypothetical protein
MALSNIFREPRREITESVVGIAAVGVFVGADYGLALLLHDGDKSLDLPACMAIVAVVVIVCCSALYAALQATHAIGDSICNALQARGIHLRPRQRR